jgi:hypothetical protein
MKAASVKEIKNALADLKKEELLAICTRLTKFKKENKELITYILFDEYNEDGFVTNIQISINEEFEQLNVTNIYFAKKNIRRIVRTVNKYIKYSGKPSTEAALLIHICKQIKKSSLEIEKSQVLINIYKSLLKRIEKSIEAMHEDLQYEFKNDLEEIFN